MQWSITPFSNLKYLQLSHQQPGAQPTVDDFIALLRASPKLETLKVNGGPGGPFRESEVIKNQQFCPSDCAVQLTSLRELEMTFFQNEAVVLLLMDIIRAPFLVSLRLKDWIGDNFDQAVMRAGNPDPALGYTSTVELDMRALEGTGSIPFYALLSGMVNVQKLALSCTDKPQNHAVSCLVPPRYKDGTPRPPVVMPELIEFKFTGIPADEVQTMLETRRGLAKPLKKLVVNEWDNVRSIGSLCVWPRPDLWWIDIRRPRSSCAILRSSPRRSSFSTSHARRTTNTGRRVMLKTISTTFRPARIQVTRKTELSHNLLCRLL
jgi:hypothetical protein